MRMCRVVQAQRLRKFRPLYASVRLREGKAQPVGNLRVRQLNALAWALRGFQGGVVLPKPRDAVENVIDYECPCD